MHTEKLEFPCTVVFLMFCLKLRLMRLSWGSGGESQARVESRVFYFVATAVLLQAGYTCIELCGALGVNATMMCRQVSALFWFRYKSANETEIHSSLRRPLSQHGINYAE
jgi:hypothetical protein